MKTTSIIYKPKTNKQQYEFICHLKLCGYKVNGHHDYLDSIITDSSISHTYIGNYHSLKKSNRIDCKDNIILAKALSALCDNLDYMQYFICFRETIDGFKTDWYLCQDEKFDIYSRPAYYIEYHKASKYELIERF